MDLKSVINAIANIHKNDIRFFGKEMLVGISFQIDRAGEFFAQRMFVSQLDVESRVFQHFMTFPTALAYVVVLVSIEPRQAGCDIERTSFGGIEQFVVYI